MHFCEGLEAVMRLAILLVGGAAAGALSVGAIRTTVPSNAPMFQAVRALGGDVSNFKIDDINPLKAYERVRHEIASGNIGSSINFGTTKPITFGNVGNLSLGNKLQIDEGAIRRAVGANINSRVQQDIRRSQDLAAYGRNPMAWHGAPPH
jgi:hypothetical protein